MNIAISKNKTGEYNFYQIISYLNNKSVPFVVREYFNENESTDKKIVLDITKRDRFYRANGAVVSLNVLNYIVSNSN